MSVYRTLPFKTLYCRTVFRAFVGFCHHVLIGCWHHDREISGDERYHYEDTQETKNSLVYIRIRTQG